MQLNTERVASNSCLVSLITGISSTMLIIRISLAGAVVVAHRRPKLIHGEKHVHRHLNRPQDMGTVPNCIKWSRLWDACMIIFAMASWPGYCWGAGDAQHGPPAPLQLTLLQRVRDQRFQQDPQQPLRLQHRVLDQQLLQWRIDEHFGACGWISAQR